MSQPPAGEPSRTPEFLPPGHPSDPPVTAWGEPLTDQVTTALAVTIQAEPPVVPMAPVERVGRGVLFSLAAIPVGAAITIGVWQLGYVASITALAMAAAAVWLYAKGAGSPPSKGAFAVIAVIVAGVAASAVGVIASDAFRYLAKEYPGTALGDQVSFVVENLGDPAVWQSYGGDFAMFSLFAALGTFGVIRKLGRAKAV